MQTWVRKDSGVGWRMLSIHFAIYSDAPFEVVDVLTKLYPEGADQSDDQGYLPIHLVANNFNSNDEIIESLLRTSRRSIHQKNHGDW